MEKVEEESTETKKVERKKPAPKVGYRIDDTSWRIIKNVYSFIKTRKKWRDQGELKHKKLTAEATGKINNFLLYSTSFQLNIPNFQAFHLLVYTN